MNQGGFHFGSAVTGFAIGLIVALLASIAILPDHHANGRPISLRAVGSGGGGGDDSGGLALDDPGAGGGGGGGSTITKTSGGSSSGGGSSSSKTGGSKASTTSGGSAGSTGRAGGSTGGGSSVAGGGTGGAGSGSTGGGGSAQCAAGSNGGATDTGVTATQIKLGATYVGNGLATSFLGEVRDGMQAVVKKVNGAGGVCGRQLSVVYKDDGWSAETGARYIQNLVQDDKVFALAVSPSSEGLNQASNAHYFEQQGVPVVGADGLNVTQFKDPMIWPVAAATTTTIDIMMKDAADRAGGVKNLHPAIVFGNTYRFGIEGAFAANAAYRDLTAADGAAQDIPGYKNPLGGGVSGCGGRFCGISTTDDFATRVSEFNSACGSGPPCNFVILLLEPATALQWHQQPASKPAADPQYTLGMSGPQPLFTYDFAKQCGDWCNKLQLWTGYNPPLDRYASNPDVAAFVNDLQAQRNGADKFNQFTMGGYLGMEVLVEALKKTGPNLTRKALTDTLNSMDPFVSGLAAPLAWRPNARYANDSAQSFRIEALNGFSGSWKLQHEPMKDPWLGQHTG